MRTRLPGGVGGARSAMSDPYPDQIDSDVPESTKSEALARNASEAPSVPYRLRYLTLDRLGGPPMQESLRSPNWPELLKHAGANGSEQVSLRSPHGKSWS